jgi:hypothetical protein
VVSWWVGRGTGGEDCRQEGGGVWEDSRKSLNQRTLPIGESIDGVIESSDRVRNGGQISLAPMSAGGPHCQNTKAGIYPDRDGIAFLFPDGWRSGEEGGGESEEHRREHGYDWMNAGASERVSLRRTDAGMDSTRIWFI